MYDILKTKNISCHHGSLLKENNLQSAINILNENPEIDIIEIDFVLFENQYISAHDHELIVDGSSLQEWIDMIIERNKILWIDLKDTSLSFFINSYTTLNVELLFNILDVFHLKYPLLHEHILIGCQYIHVYEQLMKNNINKFTIIQDLPRDKMYVLEAITPNEYITLLENVVLDSIIEDTNSKIIAVDKKFFSDIRLNDLLSNINNDIIIIMYNFKKSDNLSYIKNTRYIKDKHIIYQYDY
jgi:hypothetical protein